MIDQTKNFIRFCFHTNSSSLSKIFLSIQETNLKILIIKEFIWQSQN
jgi:hypothetical protein